MNKLSETDKAYLAGYYDGEACFQIHKRWHTVNDYRYIGYSMCSEVASTNKDVLIYIQNLLGAGSIGAKKQKGNRKDAWYFKLGAADTRDLINNIMPYSKIKVPIMNVCLRFPLRGIDMTKAEKDCLKEVLHEEARILNFRGL